jgi:hypothetical protein
MIICILARITSQISEFETVWNWNVQVLILAGYTRFVLPSDAAPDFVGPLSRDAPPGGDEFELRNCAPKGRH